MARIRKRRFLILADPVERLHPESDTGFALARVALERGHEVYWSTDQQYALDGDRVVVSPHRVLSCPEGQRPVLEQAEALPARVLFVRDFDGVWIRKDPPFNDRYLWICWLLALEEKNVPIWNPPSALIRHHEKLMGLEMLASGVLKKDDVLGMSIPTGDAMPIRWLVSGGTSGAFVTKPWLGYGGRDVEKWDSSEHYAREMGDSPRAYTIFQAFQPQVLKTGDRRVFFLSGKYFGDFARIPGKGSIRSNLAQGGSAQRLPLTAKEKRIIPRIGRFLKSNGIILAGVDLIGGKVSEINITAPTGYGTLKKMGGPDVLSKYLSLAEAACRSRRSRA